MQPNGPQLFRPKAVEAALGSQIGEAFASHWRGVAIFTALAFGLTALLFLLLSRIEYSPTYRVPCYTDVESGLTRLTSPIDGQVTELAVTEGDHIKKGALLAVLSTDKLRAGGDSQRSAIADRLQAEQASIEREIDSANKEAAANREMLAGRISGLKLELTTARADARFAEELLASLREQAEQFAPLVAQGYVSKLQLAQKHDEVIRQESRVASSRAALQRIERDIATSEAERKLIDPRLNEVVENRRRAADDLQRLSVQSDVDAEQVIRAPADGLVSTSTIVKGQSVEQGQALFSIVPTNEPLIARLLVPARAAAVVKPGMNIRFNLRAYPSEKFGSFQAHVLSVSVTPVVPGDATQMLSVTEASFIAIAGLPARLIGPDGHPLRIKPGMVGEASVPVERRTMLEWIVDPLLRGLNGDPERTSRQSHGGLP
jgi:membrane fusion protein